MKSRERVKRAIHFQGPDHMPHYLPDGKENDILWLWIERPPDIQPWTDVDDHQRRVDAWGVVWERVNEETFGEAVVWPVADVTRQASYTFPDLNNPRYFEAARHRIEANRRAENPKYCLGVMPFSSLNEGTHNIVGLQNMFMAYYEHPDDLQALIGRFAEHQRESIHMLADIGCDGVMGYDDWGLQDRLMVRPSMIKQFFVGHYRRNWALAHSLGMDVWLHSCGHILEILPTFVDAGLDVIQMDQQENMGLENLDARVGGELAFWCPVDIQQTMVEGSIAEIEAYVKRMINTVGSHNGGLISMAYSTPEAVHHTREKVMAMSAAFRTYGVYS
ncbi:MAG: uroporphyrinogen decarboxylase family protein [Anaerolineae bacterium]